jgi:Tfp pilus assembly protein PilF
LIAASLEWDWDRAEQEFRRAIELDPGYVWGRQVYAGALASRGQLDEAREQLERARDLDPARVSPSQLDLGIVYALQGDVDASTREWNRSLELDPGHFVSLNNFGMYLCESGEFEQGVSLLERARALYPDTPSTLASIGYCHAAAGAEQEARSRLRELENWSRREYVDPVNVALVHAGLGETDEAFAWLERGYEVRAFLLQDIVWDPRLAPLRSDLRFDDLLRRIGIVG